MTYITNLKVYLSFKQTFRIINLKVQDLPKVKELQKPIKLHILFRFKNCYMISAVFLKKVSTSVSRESVDELSLIKVLFHFFALAKYFLVYSFSDAFFFTQLCFQWITLSFFLLGFIVLCACVYSLFDFKINFIR